MLEQILEAFNDNNTSLIIEKYRKVLSKMEYLNLVSALFYYFGIKKDNNLVNDINDIISELKRNEDMIKKNQNHEFLKTLVSKWVEEELSTNGKDKIESFVNSRFLFHTFNAEFKSTIDRQGLILHEKPWDLDEVEKVRLIFKKYGKVNIFGNYQGRSSTPVFFAESLLSSPYYGLSSPTFFRKFIEHTPKYLNTYVDRDYNRAKEAMEELCLPLTNEEKEYVFYFFNKYWKVFATDNLPFIAITDDNKLGLKRNIDTLETTDDYTRAIFGISNHMMHNDVPRSSLSIFSYETVSLIDDKQKSL